MADPWCPLRKRSRSCAPLTPLNLEIHHKAQFTDNNQYGYAAVYFDTLDRFYFSSSEEEAEAEIN